MPSFNFLLSSFLLACSAAAQDANGTWDIIVVGAGPAGIIVATRMAQAGLQTLLLEQGGLSYGVTGGDLDTRRPSWLNGTNLTRTDVPGLYSSIFGNTQGNLTCGPWVNAYGGCIIGGSSAINAGLFFEPPASDYDLYFPRKWKSADIKNATQRLYAMQPSTNTTSQDGIRYLQSGFIAARSWIVETLGFQEVDLNAKANEKTAVFGYPIFDYSNGQRGGPVVNYLQLALQKPNFKLMSGVHVIRVDRHPKNIGHATGVTATVDGEEKVFPLTSKGRIISSGGALQSPALLMFSGIGDPTILKMLQDAGKLSPALTPSQWVNTTWIGKGLFDNPNTFIELSSPIIDSYAYSYDNPDTQGAALYLQHRSGPYSFAGQTSVFWDTTKHSDGTVAALQGTIGPAGFADYTDNNTVTLNIYGTSGLKSRGNVVLGSNFLPGPDGLAYYSDPQDALDIATFIYKIFQALPISTSGITPLNIPQNATVAQIQTYITTYSQYARGQVNHWSSSCKIGECVDHDTVVKGVRNLHVVDASIVEPLTVNPQFGVMVAAERASELILGLMGKSIIV